MQIGYSYDAGESKFTSKERDSESSLDNFGARYNASSLGRFMSPDWSEYADPVPHADRSGPQSLNIYSYVGNNPLRFIDPDGHSHQVCDPDTYSTDPKTGALTVHGGACHTVADWYDLQGFRNWANQAAGAAMTSFIRWGRLGGPAHRAAVQALSRYWRAQGYKVDNEVRINTPGGAKPYRFADVYGTKTNPDGTTSTRIGQIGRTYADGQTPVAREQSALNDIQTAEPGANVEFYDYQAPFPSETSIPGWPVNAPSFEIPGVGEMGEPIEPE